MSSFYQLFAKFFFFILNYPTPTQKLLDQAANTDLYKR